VAGPGAKVSDLEARIDALYQGPLGEFTTARNALVRTLTGTAADRVKRLTKPVPVAWIVNQIAWHARSVYDRLLAAGAALRRVQIAAIERPGPADRAADTRRDERQRAVTAHAKAVADAVHQGLRLASAAGVRPPVDVLTRMLEAISLAPEHPDFRGRLTDTVAPTGFGVFAGVVAPAGPDEPEGPARGRAATSGPARSAATLSPADVEKSRRRAAAGPAPRQFERARREAAARDERRREAARALAEAQQVETARRDELAAAERAQADGEQTLARLVSDTARARAALAEAARARETAARLMADLG
jgi:hypothetical protein